jgi:hypothetical protein
MAHIFPLFSDVEDQTLTLEIAATATSKTVGFNVDSRKVLINAQGADAAPTYTVNIEAPVGLIFFVDITSLNSNTGAAASTVVFSKAGSTVEFDAAGDQACIFVNGDGKLVDGANFLGTVFSTTSGATFA